MTARLPTLALLALALGLLVGCGNSLYTDYRYRTGENVNFLSVPDLAIGRDKAWVIGNLGPPDQVLPRNGGDTFVYRDRNVDQTTLNLHTGFFAPVTVPVYFDAEGERYVRRLNVYFDAEGTVQDVAFPIARRF